MEFTKSGAPLSEAGLAATVTRLRVDPAALWAVIRVETSGFGFLADRRPKILFERHIFHGQTGGRFNTLAPDLSNPEAGGHGAPGAAQYERLERAMSLNRLAALRSTSWGLGQVMGFHAETLGYRDAEAMVQAMVEGEDRQLEAMERFIVTTHLDIAMRARDWPGFALRYNGANFAANEYDKKLEAAFLNLVAKGLPDVRVRAAQAHLVYQGFNPGGIDGVMGPRTRAALQAFQQKVGLASTGEADDSTLDRLAEA
jgi:hypothetical protein